MATKNCSICQLLTIEFTSKQTCNENIENRQLGIVVLCHGDCPVMCIVIMKIILACRVCFFLHFQPEKMAEGLLLFIQGLGLGKTSILHV